MDGSLVRRATKAAVLPFGLGSRRRGGDVVVLLYHRVGYSNAEIELTPETFEAHLGHLAARTRVLTLDEALGGEGDGGVVVTFDDGTPDFYATVLPLLVRHGVPATLYLATGSVSSNGSSERLGWTQVQEAAGTGLVTVGSHTHSHADLSRADEATSEEEMRRSKEMIEDRLGTACRHFAYPWAVASAAADRVARQLFDSAALDAWRTNRRDTLDPHRLGRTPVLRSDGVAFFRAKAAGLLDGEALLYRALGRGPWGRR